MLPPASTSTTLLALERVELAGEERGERRGARAFDDALLELDQAQDRERDRRFVDGDDAIDDALDDLERHVAELRDSEPVGERRRQATRASACPAASAAVKHAARSGSTPIDRARRARFALTAVPMPGDQAAAADRHDDRLDVGRLLEDLEPHRALAGDHVRRCRTDG